MVTPGALRVTFCCQERWAFRRKRWAATVYCSMRASRGSPAAAAREEPAQWPAREWPFAGRVRDAGAACGHRAGAVRAQVQGAGAASVCGGRARARARVQGAGAVRARTCARDTGAEWVRGAGSVRARARARE
jgi:hypothetical protein